MTALAKYYKQPHAPLRDGHYICPVEGIRRESWDVLEVLYFLECVLDTRLGVRPQSLAVLEQRGYIRRAGCRHYALTEQGHAAVERNWQEIAQIDAALGLMGGGT